MSRFKPTFVMKTYSLTIKYGSSRLPDMVLFHCGNACRRFKCCYIVLVHVGVVEGGTLVEGEDALNSLDKDI
jgi:hypothetical protein